MNALLPNLRYERKFPANGDSLAEVLAVVRRHPAVFREIYPARTVNNLYLDTLGLRDYFDHVNGVANRLKTRVRWYGAFNGQIAQPALERKLKCGLLSGKEVAPLPPLALQGGEILTPLADALEHSGIPATFRTCLRQLLPTLLNRYQRRYFQSADGRFRLTVDWNLQFADARSNVSTEDGWNRQDPSVIVELKYAPEAAELAADVTNALPWRLTRCSKYILGLECLLAPAETGSSLPSPGST